MKASDLRLGNRMNGGVVCGINNGFIHIAGPFNITGMASFQEHELRPELLTEEWLLKFGFAKYESENFVSSIILIKNIVDSGMKKIALYNYPKSGFSVCFCDYYTGKEKTEIFPTEIKYIHQIQNLYFSLTGEELTIKP